MKNGKNHIIKFLDQSIKIIPGIGDKTAEKIANLVGGNRLKNILYHFPVDIVDRTYHPKIKDIEVGKVATLNVEILEYKEGYSYRSPFKVICSDGTGKIIIPFFGQKNTAWIKEKLPLFEKRIISGKTEAFKKEIHMSHPDYILEEKYLSNILTKEAVYPLTAGITNKFLRAIIYKIFNKLDELQKTDKIPEWQDETFKNQQMFDDIIHELKLMHYPQKRKDFSPEFNARKRLAYDEILASQLALGLLHKNERQIKGVINAGTGDFTKKLSKSLPFDLTNAQQRCITEISKDMKDKYRMLRLLQGDVGSGKTIVALFSMLQAIESGGQAAIMAPTDILTQQHYKGIFEMLQKAGLFDKVRVEVLTGRDTGKEKTRKLYDIKNGSVDLVVGTHSLFQKSVEFSDLRLAVVDEQHRFGVEQRLGIVEKSKNNPCDVLAMSATPIPRTLTMTIYGDMDLSIIDELPPNRQKITTTTVSNEKLEKLILSLQAQIKNGEKAYWVCPLVEESEKLNFTAVETRYRFLKKYFGDTVNFIHGKTKKDERDRIMGDFKDVNGTIKLLVSTTVIEVGVDVPEATIMVIENSERFGLSQLHQLRGRVGRGSKKSTCVLVYGENISDISKRRLNAMKETQNGFVLAEEDLKLRGGGDILGLKQSGAPLFKIADYGYDKEFFYIAKDDAKMLINKDPNLMSDRGKALKQLLYFFDKDKDLVNILAG